MIPESNPSQQCVVTLSDETTPYYSIDVFRADSRHAITGEAMLVAQVYDPENEEIASVHFTREKVLELHRLTATFLGLPRTDTINWKALDGKMMGLNRARVKAVFEPGTETKADYNHKNREYSLLTTSAVNLILHTLPADESDK
jgi:hypothetical protein